MRQLYSIAHNIFHQFNAETSDYIPRTEIVFVVAETEYSIDNNLDLVTTRQAESFLFTTSKEGVENLIKGLQEILEEMK